MTVDAIRARLERGALIRMHYGVYAVGHVPPSPVARAAAAVLACGPGAVLSHASAAALWGFLKCWPAIPEVTAAAKRTHPSITTHRCVSLTRRDKARHLGVAVTSPARTLLDSAARLADMELLRAVSDALIARHLRERDLDEVIERNHAHPQAARLRRLAREPLSRSWLETHFRPWVKRYKLPQPDYNARLGRYEADVYYPRERLVVELDGYEFHRTRLAFEHDRERDAHMLGAGIATVRITKRRIDSAPAKEAARLRAILEARRPG